MIKNFFRLLAISLCLMLSLGLAACAVNGTDSEQESAGEQTDLPGSEIAVAPSIEEMTDMANVKEVNIYLNGVKHSLPLDDNISVLLVEGLGDTILTAVENNTLLAADSLESSAELCSIYTCLEIVYQQQVDLPIIQDDEAFVADNLLYALYANSDAANVLAINGAAFGSIGEEYLLGIVEEYALQNLQLPQFNGEEVTVAGVTTKYLKDQSDDIDEQQLGQLLYNAIVFYQHCYNQEYQSVASICTDELNRALSGDEAEPGQNMDILFHMDKYFSYQDPISIQAVYDGHFGDFIVYLNIDYVTTLEIVFLMIDDYPYISACHLMSV